MAAKKNTSNSININVVINDELNTIHIPLCFVEKSAFNLKKIMAIVNLIELCFGEHDPIAK